MKKYCVIVADGARARLFSLQEAELGDIGPNMIEQEDLSNSEAEASGKEVWSDDKPGRNAATGGSAHGYDDHRDQHTQEMEHRFAKQIAAAASKLVDQQKPDYLILASEKRMLGHLREVLTLHTANLEIKEIAKDLTKLPVNELHEYLAAHNAIPERTMRNTA